MRFVLLCVLEVVCMWSVSCFWDVCFSAWRMMFVKIMFAVGISGECQKKAASVSVMNYVQFSFL